MVLTFDDGETRHEVKALVATAPVEQPLDATPEPALSHGAALATAFALVMAAVVLLALVVGVLVGRRAAASRGPPARRP